MRTSFIQIILNLVTLSLSLKDNFGFIERSDVVREIFFHFTEMKDQDRTPQLGDHVEFTIQTRNGKEVACSIEVLALGTVIFEDVGTEFFKGQVLKTLDRNFASMKFNAGANGLTSASSAAAQTDGDALNGRIKFR